MELVRDSQTFRARLLFSCPAMMLELYCYLFVNTFICDRSIFVRVFVMETVRLCCSVEIFLVALEI